MTLASHQKNIDQVGIYTSADNKKLKSNSSDGKSIKFKNMNFQNAKRELLFYAKWQQSELKHLQTDKEMIYFSNDQSQFVLRCTAILGLTRFVSNHHHYALFLVC